MSQSVYHKTLHVEGRGLSWIGPDPVFKMHIFMEWNGLKNVRPIKKDLILAFADSTKYQSSIAQVDND